MSPFSRWFWTLVIRWMRWRHRPKAQQGTQSQKKGAKLSAALADGYRPNPA
jgi:hypothetical protein